MTTGKEQPGKGIEPSQVQQEPKLFDETRRGEDFARRNPAATTLFFFFSMARRHRLGPVVVGGGAGTESHPRS